MLDVKIKSFFFVCFFDWFFKSMHLHLKSVLKHLRGQKAKEIKIT